MNLHAGTVKSVKSAKSAKSRHSVESKALVERVVIGVAISPLIWIISIVTLLIAALITTPEPPSRVSGVRVEVRI